MSKAARFLLGGCISIILLLGAFSGGVVVGWFLPHNSTVSGILNQKSPAAAQNLRDNEDGFTFLIHLILLSVQS